MKNENKSAYPSGMYGQQIIDKHEYSNVKCDLCSHEWVAVRPLGLEKLECPNCANIVYFENI